MELEVLQALIKTNDFEKIKENVIQEKLLYIGNAGYASENGNTGKGVFNFSHLTLFRKQYYPHHHDVMDPTLRKNKIVTNQGGTREQAVSRLPIPMQQLIVSRAASFLCGNPIEIEAAPQGTVEEDLVAVIEKLWEDNKLDYESKHLAKLMMSETECAELWYAEKADAEYWKDISSVSTEYRLRMRVLAHSRGDIMFPIFNSAGDMVAFARNYQQVDDGKVLEHFDIYTDQVIFYASNKGGKLDFVSNEKNLLGKIPVIYYNQAYPEWFYVQNLIDRYETMISNHADTNDYFAAPIVKVKGKVAGFSDKGEQGKVIEIEGDGDASYLTWVQSSESLALEYKNLRSMIFDLTDTPDISIEQMKSIGTFSGIALKMLFLNAHLKAADKEETFGKGIQRRLNFLKAAIININTKLDAAKQVSLKPKFEYYLPKDEKGVIDMLTEAVTGGIMSVETAVNKNPLVENAADELTKISDEKAAAPVPLM